MMNFILGTLQITALLLSAMFFLLGVQTWDKFYAPQYSPVQAEPFHQSN